jgi:DNA repair protein RecN (Recombination protein N)
MLAKLTIKNVALIENAELEFVEGLNVLSGETGAGKSVVLDSLNFVLGAKADRSMIRYGETECFVKAEFFVSETALAVQVLRDMDIDTDGEIIISRKFSENGKNALKINGNTVTVGMLRQVTDSLVDVHGQSEHFFLLQESNQLKTLDAVVGTPIQGAKADLSELLKEKKRIDEQTALLGGDEKERGRRIDVLRFQIDEIVAVDLKDGEEDELLAKRNKINHIEKIISSLREVSGLFSGDCGVMDGLRQAKRAFGGIASLDKEYEDIATRIESLAIEADDLAETITSLGDDLYFDENEAEETEKRIDAIRALKRKYGANKAEIDAYLEGIQNEYDLLSNCEEQYAKLTAQRSKLLKKIYAKCQTITELRKSHGTRFCERVTKELVSLNIPHAQFEIRFNDYSEGDADKANTSGLDDICFLFSANAGEPMKPLGKIISGGEMSRFMLAVKTQLSDVNEISTYVFDEIDAGISGKTAKVVGEKLATIATQTQILAVSHLAQIAVMSDKEFLIEKVETDGKTITTVRNLESDAQLAEIARLLGGTEKDEYAVKHAEEMLKMAKEYKKSIS